MITSFALLSVSIALNLADVVITVPLINMTPLFVLLFTKLFLKVTEKATFDVTIAALMVVAGATFIVTG